MAYRGTVQKKSQVLATIIAAIVFVMCMMCLPCASFAVSQQDLENLQRQVEQSAQEYDDAVAHLDELQGKIAENRDLIDDLGGKIDTMRDQCAQSMRIEYELSKSGYGLTDVIFGSTSLNEFLTSIEYIESIQRNNADAMRRYGDTMQTYESAQSDLEAEVAQAQQEKDRAATALEEAKRTRQEMQARAEQEAREQAERERVAREQAERERAEQAEKLEATGYVENGSVNWDVDKDAFISEWTKRIDAYLGGSPMAGTGKYFAESAWRYGVDPRWSAAITNTESSKGLYVPYGNSYNAWGLTNGPDGFERFDSWESGIRRHVEYLAHNYGYTITVAHAKKYCPPNWENWYKNTLSEMNKI